MSDRELERRVVVLQETLARLAREVADARSELQRVAREVPRALSPDAVPSPSPAAPSEPPAPRSAGSPRATNARPGFEQLIGRYGALALGALTVIMGLGALVSWAIAHDLLGPEVRVALGALFTAALAGIGWRLRARDPRFGDVLLALSLASLHVVAWGAGPALHLVPTLVALVVADAGSIALAALALADANESVFAVGFGSAMLAPFVLTTGARVDAALVAYGLAVMTAAARSMRGRAWGIGVIVTIAGTFVYWAAVGSYDAGVPLMRNTVAAVFALSVAVLALAWPNDPRRPAVAVAATVLAGLSLALLSATPDVLLAPARIAVAVCGAVVALAVVRGFPARVTEGKWLAAALVLPGLFVNEPFTALPRERMASAGVRVTWAVLYATAAYANTARRRELLAALGGVFAAWAVSLATHGTMRPIALAILAVALAIAARRAALPRMHASVAVALGAAWSLALYAVVARGYSNMPFFTSASLACGAVVLCAALAMQWGIDDDVTLKDVGVRRRHLAACAAAVSAFAWGAVELSYAFDRDASTFLFVVYLAVCGVAAIALGRARGVHVLRQLGLASAVAAALDALIFVFAVDNVALRVGSYLAVGAFLLGVAWWYRAESPGDE